MSEEPSSAVIETPTTDDDDDSSSSVASDATLAADIFVSYATVDRRIVERIRKDVERLTGFTTWMDHRRLQGGDNWEKEIERNLRGCRIFIVAVSKASNSSKWVRRETILAEQLKKKRIPLLIEENREDNCNNNGGGYCESALPFRLLDLQFIDFCNRPYNDALGSLVDVLQPYAIKNEAGNDDDDDHDPYINSTIDLEFFSKYDTLKEELQSLQGVESELADSEKALMLKHKDLEKAEEHLRCLDELASKQRDIIDTTALQAPSWFWGGASGKIRRSQTMLTEINNVRPKIIESIANIKEEITLEVESVDELASKKQQKDFFEGGIGKMRDLAFKSIPSSHLYKSLQNNVKLCDDNVKIATANSSSIEFAVDLCEQARDAYKRAEEHWNQCTEYKNRIRYENDPSDQKEHHGNNNNNKRIDEAKNEREESSIRKWDEASRRVESEKQKAKQEFEVCVQSLNSAPDRIPGSLRAKYPVIFTALQSFSSQSFYSTIGAGRPFMAAEQLEVLYFIRFDLRKEKESVHSDLKIAKSEFESEKDRMLSNLRKAVSQDHHQDKKDSFEPGDSQQEAHAEGPKKKATAATAAMAQDNRRPEERDEATPSPNDFVESAKVVPVCIPVASLSNAEDFSICDDKPQVLSTQCRDEKHSSDPSVSKGPARRIEMQCKPNPRE